MPSEAAEPTLLITRPVRQAERFRDAAAGCFGPGLTTIVSPIMTIRPRRTALDLHGVAGLVLTSENAVAALPQPLPAGLAAWCVGPRTTAAASEAGLAAGQAGRDAAELTATLRARPPPLPLLHARGAHTRGDLAEALTGAGVTTRAQVVYDQQPVALSTAARRCLADTSPVLLPLFSPRSAALVGAEARAAAAPLYLAAMSAAVAAAWSGPTPAACIVAATPDRSAMLDALATVLPGWPPT